MRFQEFSPFFPPKSDSDNNEGTILDQALVYAHEAARGDRYRLRYPVSREVALVAFLCDQGRLAPAWNHFTIFCENIRNSRSF
jgi:hypothetical protein